jgi:hypothetical protein
MLSFVARFGVDAPIGPLLLWYIKLADRLFEKIGRVLEGGVRRAGIAPSLWMTGDLIRYGDD